MRFLLLLAAMLGLSWVFHRFRRRHLSVRGVFTWSALWVVVGVVAAVPEVTNRLADLLGIGRGADVVVYSAIVVIIAVLFRTSVRMEQLERAITTVTRELALREHDRGRRAPPQQT